MDKKLLPQIVVIVLVACSLALNVVLLNKVSHTDAEINNLSSKIEDSENRVQESIDEVCHKVESLQQESEVPTFVSSCSEY